MEKKNHEFNEELIEVLRGIAFEIQEVSKTLKKIRFLIKPDYWVDDEEMDLFNDDQWPEGLWNEDARSFHSREEALKWINHFGNIKIEIKSDDKTDMENK